MRLPSFRRILHVVGILILIASVIPFVLYAVPEAVGAEQSYIVTSESMTPAIPLGSIVLVDEDTAPRAYEKGDVITFRTGTEPAPTTHRIVEVRQSEDGRSFVTKGDANEDRDAEPVDSQQIVGEVTLTIPYAGHVILLVNSRYGFFAFVALPLFLLLADTAWRIVSDSTDDPATAPEDAPQTDAASRSSATRATGTGTQGESSGGIRITSTDLRMTLVVLVAFAAYGGWTVTRGLNPIKTAVTVAAGSAALIVLGLVLVTRFGGAGSDDRTPVDPNRETTVESERQPSVPPTTAADRGATETASVHEFLEGLDGADGSEERDGHLADGGPDRSDADDSKPAVGTPGDDPTLFSGGDADDG